MKFSQKNMTQSFVITVDIASPGLFIRLFLTYDTSFSDVTKIFTAIICYHSEYRIPRPPHLIKSGRLVFLRVAGVAGFVVSEVYGFLRYFYLEAEVAALAQHFYYSLTLGSNRKKKKRRKRERKEGMCKVI